MKKLEEKNGYEIKRFQPLTLFAIAALLACALPVVTVNAQVAHNSGFYDNQIIEYEATARVTSSPQAAQQLSKGNIVYHIVDANGNVPEEQLVRLLAALPNVATSGNVLNFIPSEVGYTGGAWNLQIFHWNPGVTITELSSEEDILAARDAGKGTIEVTATLVRCPVINFANLR